MHICIKKSLIIIYNLFILHSDYWMYCNEKPKKASFESWVVSNYNYWHINFIEPQFTCTTAYTQQKWHNTKILYFMGEAKEDLHTVI